MSRTCSLRPLEKWAVGTGKAYMDEKVAGLAAGGYTALILGRMEELGAGRQLLGLLARSRRCLDGWNMRRHGNTNYSA